MANEIQYQVSERSRIILVPRAHLVNKARLFRHIRENATPKVPQQFYPEPIQQKHLHNNNFQRSQSVRPTQLHNAPIDPQFNRNQSFRTPNHHNDNFMINDIPPPPPPQPDPQFHRNQSIQTPQQYPNYHNEPPPHNHINRSNSVPLKKTEGGSSSFLFSGNFDPNRPPQRQVTASVPLFGDNRKRTNDDLNSSPSQKVLTSKAAKSSILKHSPSKSKRTTSELRNPLVFNSNQPQTEREDLFDHNHNQPPPPRKLYLQEDQYEDGSIFVGNKINDTVASSMLGVSRKKNSLDDIEYRFMEEESEGDLNESSEFFREQGDWMAENVLHGEDLLDGIGGNFGGMMGGKIGAKLGKKFGNEEAGERLGKFAGEEMGEMGNEAAMEALGEMGVEMPDGLPEGLEMPDGLPEGLEMPDGLPEGMENPDMGKLCKGCSIM